MLCIAAGIGLGHLLPQLFQSIGRMEIAQINLPVMLQVRVVNASVSCYELAEGIKSYDKCCPSK